MTHPTAPGERYSPGDMIGGRYCLERHFRGSRGELYFCLDLQTNHPVALKCWRLRYPGDSVRQARLEARFSFEAEFWAALGPHPNIVRYFSLETIDGLPFMVLEWVVDPWRERTSLDYWLKQRGPLPLSLALGLASDVCQGLSHANRRWPGFVHRDLKPGNILLGQDMAAKITDFGFAYVPGHGPLPGKGVGTPPYMAPEQWRQGEVDGRADIYGIGCTLYTLLTGQRLFPVRGRAGWRWAHLNLPPPNLPSSFPESVNRLIQTCLRKEPEARFSTVETLREALSETLSSRQIFSCGVK